jgi:hypothetical protein
MKNSKASNKSTLRLVLALALLSTSVDMTLSSVWGMDENGLGINANKRESNNRVGNDKEYDKENIQKNILTITADLKKDLKRICDDGKNSELLTKSFKAWNEDQKFKTSLTNIAERFERFLQEKGANDVFWNCLGQFAQALYYEGDRNYFPKFFEDFMKNYRAKELPQFYFSKTTQDDIEKKHNERLSDDRDYGLTFRGCELFESIIKDKKDDILTKNNLKNNFLKKLFFKYNEKGTDNDETWKKFIGFSSLVRAELARLHSVEPLEKIKDKSSNLLNNFNTFFKSKNKKFNIDLINLINSNLETFVKNFNREKNNTDRPKFVKSAEKLFLTIQFLILDLLEEKANGDTISESKIFKDMQAHLNSNKSDIDSRIALEDAVNTKYGIRQVILDKIIKIASNKNIEKQENDPHLTEIAKEQISNFEYLVKFKNQYPTFESLAKDAGDIEFFTKDKDVIRNNVSLESQGDPKYGQYINIIKTLMIYSKVFKDEIEKNNPVKNDPEEVENSIEKSSTMDPKEKEEFLATLGKLKGETPPAPQYHYSAAPMVSLSTKELESEKTFTDLPAQEKQDFLQYINEIRYQNRTIELSEKMLPEIIRQSETNPERKIGLLATLEKIYNKPVEQTPVEQTPVEQKARMQQLSNAVEEKSLSGFASSAQKRKTIREIQKFQRNPHLLITLNKGMQEKPMDQEKLAIWKKTTEKALEELLKKTRNIMVKGLVSSASGAIVRTKLVAKRKLVARKKPVAKRKVSARKIGTRG